MSADTPSLLNAVTASVRSGTFTDGDKGAIALAKRYAKLIDDAEPTSVYAEHLRRLAPAIDPDNDEAAKAFTKIADALAQHSVASDLGPKLLAALDALGLSPAARSKQSGGGVPRVGGSKPADALAALREQRAQRPA